MPYLRLNPFPQDTESGRSAERYRRTLWTVLTSFVARGMGMATLVAAVSLTVPYLGTERFGAWMTMASLASMLTFLDLGIGNALTNKVAKAASSHSKHDLARAVSGGLGVLGIVSVILAVLLVVIAATVPWASLIKLQSPQLNKEVEDAALLFALLFAITTFTNGVSRIFFGLQRGFEVHLAGTIGSMVSLAATYFAASAQAGLPMLLFCTMMGTIIANSLLLLRLGQEGHFSTAGWGHRIIHETPSLLHSGSLFFLLQIGTMVGWGADSLIIANSTGAASVAAYALIQRLILLVSQPLAMMNAPLWSAYADAHLRKESYFVRKTFKRSFAVTFTVSSFGALLLFLSGQNISLLWTQGNIEPDIVLLLVMSIWLILEATGTALGVLLNGLGIVKQQVWIVSAFVLVALPLKLWWAQPFGAIGVVSAGIVAYVVTTVIGYGIFFRKDIVEQMR